MRKWHNFINESKDSSRVSKVILFNGDKILFLVSKNEPYVNELDLPGGHIHYGEDPVEGLIRETREETGLILKNANELVQNKNITFYWGNLPSGQITLSDEHSDYHISSYDEIMKKGFKISNQYAEAINLAYQEVNK